MSSTLFCRYVFVFLVIYTSTNVAYNSSLCGICKVKDAPRNQNRIIGGTPSQLNQWPWMTAIFEFNLNNSLRFDFICGGVLISDFYVLTAAHCITNASESSSPTKPPSDLRVRLGELDHESDADGAHPMEFHVANVYIQPDFSYDMNDIGLLKLDKTVTFSESIRPICLPTVQMKTDTFEGKQAYIVGWGTTKYKGNGSSGLRHAKVQVYSNKECQPQYNRVYIIIQNSKMCAGSMEGGKDACQGDSGGPLMYPLKNKWYSIGVTSTGHMCAEPGYPGIFARTTEYLDWIKKTAEFN